VTDEGCRVRQGSPLPLALTVPKVPGQRNEDSFQRSRKGVHALSDGASVSFDSASWSTILVRRFARDPEFSREWLSAAIAEFSQLYDRDSLPWMQQAAFDRGSFASLLGVRILNEGERIRVTAIGDSLAVLCDGDAIQATFPYLNASEFEQRPQLLCTNPAENAFIDDEEFGLTRVVEWTFWGLERPTLFCMTDALGHWVLSSNGNPSPIATIRNLKTMREFERFVEAERLSSRMRRDDTTLLAIG
jgi:hypothetical protein